MPRNDVAGYDALYRGEDQPPWEIQQAQPALAAVLDQPLPGNRVLDLGCGSGELALLLAGKGYAVTAVDFSAAAIELGREKAAAQGLAVTFDVVDALAPPETLRDFDAVFDSGLLHSLLPDERETYLATLRGACRPGGVLHLLSVSLDAGQDFGLTREELTKAFASGWTAVRVEPTMVAARSLQLGGWLVQAVRAS